MPTDPLSRTFSALAHPARRAMLARLGQGQASVQELSRPLKMSAPAVSKHLKILEGSGLIRRSRNAQWRPCELDVKTIQAAGDWIDEVKAMTQGRLDRLEAYIETLRATAKQIEDPNQTPSSEGD